MHLHKLSILRLRLNTAKNVEIPTTEMLIEKIFEVVEMDVFERMEEGDVDRIENIWKVFYSWLDR